MTSSATSSPTLAVQPGPLSADLSSTELTLSVYDSASPAVKQRMLTQLVAQVYSSAPLTLRRHLLDRLLRPLGLLSLVTLANGIFARIRLQGEWPHLQARMEDVQNVQSSDVVALVDYVQLVSANAITGLIDVISASPLATGSAAASVLLMLLMRNARRRRNEDADS